MNLFRLSFISYLFKLSYGCLVVLLLLLFMITTIIIIFITHAIIIIIVFITIIIIIMDKFTIFSKLAFLKKIRKPTQIFLVGSQ